MDVVLTWSGEESHDIASFLYEWLPEVAPGVKPWISDEDLTKGRLWFPELMEQLVTARVSITCITPENVRSPWVFFEVGAIAVKLPEGGIVCPYLIGVDPEKVADTPLPQLQCTTADEKDTWRMIKSINRVLGDRSLDEKLVKRNFEARWPKLRAKLSGEVESIVEAPSSGTVFITEPVPVPANEESILSKEAMELLVNASDDENGTITYVRSMHGADLSTNGENFISPYNARNEALWKGALDNLVDEGLVEPRGHQGVTFAVTNAGFKYADTLK